MKGLYYCLGRGASNKTNCLVLHQKGIRKYSQGRGQGKNG